MTSVKGILRRFAALSLLGACVLGGASCRLADKRACVTCQGAKPTPYLAEGIDLAPPPDAVIAPTIPKPAGESASLRDPPKLPPVDAKTASEDDDGFSSVSSVGTDRAGPRPPGTKAGSRSPHGEYRRNATYGGQILDRELFYLPNGSRP